MNWPAAVMKLAAVLLRYSRGHLEKGWCRGAQAATLNGLPCAATDRAACAWCPAGAVDRVAADAGPEYAVAADAAKLLLAVVAGLRLNGSDDLSDWGNIAHYCDAADRTLEEVLSLVDGAVALVGLGWRPVVV